MATVKYNIAYDDLYQMAADYGHLAFDKKHSDASEIVYVDTVTHDKLVIDGSGLGHDTHGVVSKGTITSVHFEDPSGKHLIDVAGLKISGAAAHQAYVTQNIAGIVDLVFGGDDTITGSSGNDYIVGWGGNDVINGGKGHDTLVGYTGDDVINVKDGNDIVYFDHGYGHDKVLHFNANGGDLIWTQSTDYKVVGTHNNDDTIIKFTTGDELLLIGVNHNQITASDFFHV
jgi:Ca2+-binding RTX toxin-like protein